MVKTKNDLPEKSRIIVCGLLNARLADALDLWMQAKQAHWNVKGPQFIALHELFDKVAENVEDGTDLIAERAIQLGGQALGTLQVVAQKSSLKKYPLDILEGPKHIEALSQGLADYAKNLNKDILLCAAENDAGTADLLTEVSRSTEKDLWFVESHLQSLA